MQKLLNKKLAVHGFNRRLIEQQYFPAWKQLGPLIGHQAIRFTNSLFSIVSDPDKVAQLMT